MTSCCGGRRSISISGNPAVLRHAFPDELHRAPFGKRRSLARSLLRNPAHSAIAYSRTLASSLQRKPAHCAIACGRAFNVNKRCRTGLGAVRAITGHAPVKTLLIDNYDSYTYNLFQLLAQVNGVPPLVVKNDELTFEQVSNLLQEGKIDNIVISPGPGTPHQPSDLGAPQAAAVPGVPAGSLTGAISAAGVCKPVLELLADVPILGVCLGLQALAHVHGARVVHAPEPVHGRLSELEHNGHPMFASVPSGVGRGFEVVRYHSLVVDWQSVPPQLEVTAWTCSPDHALQPAAAQLGSQPVQAAESDASTLSSGRQTLSAAALAMTTVPDAPAAVPVTEHRAQLLQPRSSSHAVAAPAQHATEHARSLVAGPLDWDQLADRVFSSSGASTSSSWTAHGSTATQGSTPHLPSRVPDSPRSTISANPLDGSSSSHPAHNQNGLPGHGAGPSWNGSPMDDVVHSPSAYSNPPSAHPTESKLSHPHTAGNGKGPLSSRAPQLIMGLAHRQRPHYGVQFHPESIASKYGRELLENFRELTLQLQAQQLQQCTSGERSQAGEGGPLPDQCSHQRSPRVDSPAVEARLLLEQHRGPGKEGLLRDFQGRGQEQARSSLEHEQKREEPGTVRLLWRRLPGALSAAGGSEHLFWSLFGGEEDTFWLDSAATDRGRFSFMGGRGGPLWRRITYNLPQLQPSCSDTTTDTSNGANCNGGSTAVRAEQILAEQNGRQRGLEHQTDGTAGLVHAQPEAPSRPGQLTVGTGAFGCGSAHTQTLNTGVPQPGSNVPGYGGTSGMGGGARMTSPTHRSVATLTITSADGTSVTSATSIFDYLQHALQQLRLCTDAAVEGQLPFNFWAGFVGYFGYELKAECGGANRHAATTPDAALFLADRLIAVDHHEDAVYVLCAYSPTPGGSELSEAESWLSGMVSAVGGLGVRKEGVSDPGQQVVGQQGGSQQDVSGCDEAQPQAFQLLHPHEAYLANVAACKEALRDGDSYEVCLTTALVRRGSVNAKRLYSTLRRLNPAPYAAWLRVGGGGPTVCCSSPERFLRCDRDGVLEARPIKGTAARHADPEQDAAAARELATSEKDFAENLMIVDLLRNDLGRVCEVGSVRVPGLMEIESFATVHQLVSTVRGQRLPSASVVDCITAAFPGGSMTGAPKVRTMDIIDQLEGRARGVYSGSIGFISLNNTFDLNIVIRTAVLQGEGRDGSISIGAGGAVVVQSDPQGEFQELLLKARALLHAVGLADGGQGPAQLLTGMDFQGGSSAAADSTSAQEPNNAAAAQDEALRHEHSNATAAGQGPAVVMGQASRQERDAVAVKAGQAHGDVQGSSWIWEGEWKQQHGLTQRDRIVAGICLVGGGHGGR